MNRFGPKGRREVVFADRDRIADLYLSGRALTSLMAEYKCSYEIIKSALLSVITLQQYMDQRHKILCRGGVNSRFVKGQKSWNKGIYSRVSPGTEFKRGHLPINTKEVSEKSDCNLKPFVRYYGGKQVLSPVLLKAVPGHTCYVEVFAEAASLLFAKPPSPVEVINDLDGDIVNLFRVVKYHNREFLRHLEFMPCSRQMFSDLKKQPGWTDIQRAAASYYLINASYSAMQATFGYAATGSPCSIGPAKIAKIRTVRKRLTRVIVENLDFADLIGRYDRPFTFFYCDPPYVQGGEKYKCPFTEDDHVRLAGCLSKIKGKFLLSYDDRPMIRKLYKGFTIRKVPVRYSTTHLIDRSKQWHELLISNYPLPRNL